jgi:hypothetical protein
MKRFAFILSAIFLCLGLAWSQTYINSRAEKMVASIPLRVTVQPPALRNSSATGAANTAVTASIAAISAQNVYLFSVEMSCSAGTGSLQIKDGVSGTVIWQSPAAANIQRVFFTPLASTSGNGMDVVASTCGVSNTTTLSVQASQF